jgi:hypothetical protein
MKVKVIRIGVVCLYLLLVLFQIKTTNIKSAYTLSPSQIDLQIRRMNMFPPALARLGYIVEVKKEVQIFARLQDNFFTVVDIKEYFPSRLPYIVSPLFFIGLYFFVKERHKWQEVFYAFVLTIGILTIIGSYAKYGPVIMYPFFALFILLGLFKVIKVVNK